MFSGIIEELGRIAAEQNGDRGRLAIDAGRAVAGASEGDSIAVNGVCVTIASLAGSGFSADVMPETLGRTTLGALHPAAAVNLERSLALGDRIGGHMVTGHVDAVGTVTALRDDGNARWVTVDAPHALMPMIAQKGSIAVDGISLTVVDVFETAFTVSLIPFTLENTTAGGWSAGTNVNLEVDLVSRYVVRALDLREARP